MGKKEEADDLVEKAKTLINGKDYKEATTLMKAAIKLYPELENGLEMLIVCETLYYGHKSSEINWYSLLHLHPSTTYIKLCVQCTKLRTYSYNMKCLGFPGATVALELLEGVKSKLCCNRFEFDRIVFDPLVSNRNGSFRDKYLGWEPPIDLSDVDSIPNVPISPPEGVVDRNPSLFPELENLFDEMPQRPHYRPLDKYSSKLRQGLIIGLDVAFACLAEEILGLEDSVSFPSKLGGFMEQLEQLEEMGYNVDKLRERLETLNGVAERGRLLRSKVETFEAEVKGHESRIVDHKSRILELEAEIDKSRILIHKRVSKIGLLNKDLMEACEEFVSTAKMSF